MSEDTRTILKKLMRDALDEKDRQRLLCDQKWKSVCVPNGTRLRIA